MRPILFQVGPISISSYGLMIAVAFLLSLTLINRKIISKGDKYRNNILDLIVLMVISGIIGARLIYIILYDSFSNILKIWEGGLVFHGGLVFGLIAGYLFVYYKKMSFNKTADLLIPYLVLGQSFGRVGCFLNGCCYGTPSRLPWAVTVNNLYSGGISHVHPTQIYSALILFFLFFLLLNFRNKGIFKGQIIWIYLSVYSIIRFFLEFLRKDNQEELKYVFFSLTLFQIISLTIFVIAGTILIYKHMKQTKKSNF